MALKINNKVDFDTSKIRIFDSYIDEPSRQNNWIFKYITQDKYGQDQFITNLEVDENKNNYPVGTIFFDSDNYGIITLTSTLSKVIIDNTPPVAVSENIEYTTIKAKHKCVITFDSDTEIDIRQLSITCGDYIFFQSIRKTNKVITSKYISDISVAKNNNTYMLTFYISADYPTAKLTENQITVIIWDLAANYCKYITGTLNSDKPIKGGEDDNNQDEWNTIGKDPETGEDTTDETPDNLVNDLNHLIIEFLTTNPSDKVLSANVDGKVLVKVSNPNKDYWQIQPTVELLNGSIGYIEKNSFNYDYKTGVLTFYITNINTAGYIDIAAWITVNNKDIADKIKRNTYAEEILSGWIYCEDCRKYNLKPYVPEYLNGDTYAEFVDMVQLFLNSCHHSLNNNNANISILEKIARINNFNDVANLEYQLLDHYRENHAIDITPNLDNYIYFLNNKPENYDSTK